MNGDDGNHLRNPARLSFASIATTVAAGLESFSMKLKPCYRSELFVAIAI
jgi:hypothetical protein